jgi:hypothetical protein
MSQQMKDIKKTGPEAAQKLRALFEKWAREEAASNYEGEPSWEEVKKALNEGRPADGKPFSKE